MSEQNTSEIQSLRYRWRDLACNEVLEYEFKSLQNLGIQQIIKFILKRGWSVMVEYFDQDNVQASLNLNNDFDGPQYVSSNFAIKPDRRETDALEALLLVYVAALEESLAQPSIDRDENPVEDSADFALAGADDEGRRSF